jgi:hypothetical protein
MRSTSSSAANKVATLVDPNQREELVMTGVLTIAMNVHAEVCLLDYGGGCELHPDKLRECWTLAAECIQQLCKSLEVSLEEADGQALQERLSRLQQQQEKQHQPNEKLVLPPTVGADDLEGVPFFHSVDDKDDLMQIDEGDVDADQAADIKAQNEAEEAYRRNALDYNLGHVAQKVREDDKKKPKDHRQQASKLLTAMLQSAQGEGKVEAAADDTTLKAKGGAQGAAKVEAKAKAKPVSSPKQKEKKTLSTRASTRAKPQETDAVDSDEEDTTVQLRSEFQPAAVPDPVQVPASNAEDEDADDLAAAIKTKKKKPKKSKK